MNEEYKIKGWVARDQQVDGFWGNGLILHHSKPTRESNECPADFALFAYSKIF